MREFWAGVGDLARGFRLWSTSPRLMLLGALPAVIVGAIWTGLLVALLSALDPVAAAATPFADAWPAAWRVLARLVAGVSIVVVALLVAALSFSAVVLAIGGPFTDRISAAVELRLGDPPPETAEPLLRGLLRGARDGLVLLLVSVLVGVVAFGLGLIPVVGPVLALVLGATVGGWYLVVELTAPPFDARGHSLRARRRMLRGHRPRVLGFAIATWAVFLVPLGAVFAMPAAVGGATVLARRVLEDQGGGGDR